MQKKCTHALSSKRAGFFLWLVSLLVCSFKVFCVISNQCIVNIWQCLSKPILYAHNKEGKKMYWSKKPSETNVVAKWKRQKKNGEGPGWGRYKQMTQKNRTNTYNMHGKSLDRTQTVHNEATFCSTRHRTLYNIIYKYCFCFGFQRFKFGFFALFSVSWYCHTISIYSSINSEANVRMWDASSPCWDIRQFWSMKWSYKTSTTMTMTMTMTADRKYSAGWQKKTRGPKSVIVDVKITTKILNAPKNITIYNMHDSHEQLNVHEQLNGLATTTTIPIVHWGERKSALRQRYM